MPFRDNGIMRGALRGSTGSRGYKASGIAIENGKLYTTSGNAKVPDKVYNLLIKAWGSGAGGRSTAGRAGGGGGSGGYAKRNSKAVAPNDLIPFSVGLGGAKDTAGNATTVDSMTANGGNIGATASTTGAAGGTGGTASGGDTNTTGNTGNPGGDGNSGLYYDYLGGTGASAPASGGKGGRGAYYSPPFGTGTTRNAETGTSPGAGGGGGIAQSGTYQDGAPGADGGVRFYWQEEVLETFETLSSSRPPLFPNALGGATTSLSTSNVTQGTYSQLLSTSNGGGIGSNTLDLSAYSALKLDVTATTGNLRFRCYNSANEAEQVQATSSGTSAQTLTLDIDTVPWKHSAVVTIYESTGDNSITAYIDNFRGVITEVILEDFETIAASVSNPAYDVPGKMLWDNENVSLGSYDRDSSHATLGTYNGSFYWTAETGINNTQNYDLSAYSSFKLDVKFDSTGSGVGLRFWITDGTNSEYVTSTLNSTSAQTLTLTPTSAINLKACKFGIYAVDPSGNGSSMFFDKLRGVLNF